MTGLLLMLIWLVWLLYLGSGSKFDILDTWLGLWPLFFSAIISNYLFLF